MAASRQDPRANQKARTRAAIVAAAHEHREARGATPTVAQAAAAAGVARATAYRYFPTEAALAELPGGDAEERVLALLDAFNPIVFRQEEHFRRALWVYLDTWLRNHRAGDDAPAVREGRRMRWLDTALGPLDDLPEDRR